MKTRMLGAAPVAVFLICAATTARGQCIDSTTKIYGRTDAIRTSGNTVRLSATTTVMGNYYNWWYAASNIAWYFNGYSQSTSGMTRSATLGAQYDHWYTPTLQTYGAGTYYMGTTHDAYTPYCGGVWASAYPNWTIPPPWQTANSINIQRPVLSQGVLPFYLGPGTIRSNDYTSQTQMSANPNGATETPQWSFVAGSAYGNLSCTNCASPILQLTGLGTGCGRYDIVLKASYGGFDSTWYWIDVRAPNLLQSVRTDPPATPPGGGWESHVFYRVMDNCGQQMSNVEANEVFVGWSNYNGSNWDAPLEAYGFSSLTFDGVTASFLLRDILYEVPVAGKTPQPANGGSNGMNEATQFLMTQHTQKWRIGSTFNNGPRGIPSNPVGPREGSDDRALGVFVQTNLHFHYLDHGRH